MSHCNDCAAHLRRIRRLELMLEKVHRAAVRRRFRYYPYISWDVAAPPVGHYLIRAAWERQNGSNDTARYLIQHEAQLRAQLHAVGKGVP